jgi:2-polyprenyl-3-methyl-5-hydroxy-6-metoxy-1,4-benzoquinol methylase
MENGLTYDREIETNFNNINIEHKRVLELVGKGKNVLEVGCHTGYFSYWLTNNDCTVTGIDIYKPSIEKAKRFLNMAIVGNIEDEETWSNLNNCKFDVIIFMHVLEHLIDPEKVLIRSKGYLSSNGKVIICLPNISNWNSRVSVFKGNFNYTESGLMDCTHLRFFNYYTATNLIEKSGYNINSYSGTSKATFILVPNLRLLWRLNNPLNKLINNFIRHPNLTDSSMCFEASIKIRK